MQKRSSGGNSGAHCAVNGCNRNQKQLNRILDVQCFDHKPLLQRNCSCDPPFRLHMMPKDADSRRLWLAALRRKNPPKTVFVCSYHFVDRKPTAENQVPELYLGYEKIVKKRRVLVRSAQNENVNCQHTVSLTVHPSRRKRKGLPDETDATPSKQVCPTSNVLPVNEDASENEQGKHCVVCFHCVFDYNF